MPYACGVSAIRWGRHRKLFSVRHSRPLLMRRLLASSHQSKRSLCQDRAPTPALMLSVPLPFHPLTTPSNLSISLPWPCWRSSREPSLSLIGLDRKGRRRSSEQVRRPCCMVRVSSGAHPGTSLLGPRDVLSSRCPRWHAWAGHKRRCYMSVVVPCSSTSNCMPFALQASA